MIESNSITPGERAFAKLLNYAPWLVPLIIALPAPLYFLLRYFAANDDFAVWMLAALVSFGVGAVAGLVIALALVFYRRAWLRRLRDKLARDGVTVNELPWFEAELTATERRTLRGAKQQLLADAYRETLATRLTATRLATHAKRELVAVERRLQQAKNLSGSGRSTLENELVQDQTRLRQLQTAAHRQQAEAETRLQSIAATIGRHQIETETRIALERLDGAAMPPGIENAKLQREYEEQIRRELISRDETQTRY